MKKERLKTEQERDVLSVIRYPKWCFYTIYFIDNMGSMAYIVAIKLENRDKKGRIYIYEYI